MPPLYENVLFQGLIAPRYPNRDAEPEFRKDIWKA
jgi:hypothetical protein